MCSRACSLACLGLTAGVGGGQVSERALKTINFREEQEKLNVWVARLNLENLYGSRETLMNKFEEACKLNDAKKMHLQLLAIFEKNGEAQVTEHFFKTLTRKFRSSCKVLFSPRFSLPLHTLFPFYPVPLGLARSSPRLPPPLPAPHRLHACARGCKNRLSLRVPSVHTHTKHTQTHLREPSLRVQRVRALDQQYKSYGQDCYICRYGSDTASSNWVANIPKQGSECLTAPLKPSPSESTSSSFLRSPTHTHPRPHKLKQTSEVTALSCLFLLWLP